MFWNPLGEKLVKHIFWQKWWILKALKFQKLENANFAHFVSRLLDEKLLKHFYWQKWGILKTLKFQKVKNANFAHFVSHPLGEKLPKLLFLQTGGFWKFWSKNLKMLNLLILSASRFNEKLLKHMFWQNYKLFKVLNQLLQILEKASFAHFVSHPLGEKTTQRLLLTKVGPSTSIKLTKWRKFIQIRF